MTQIPSIEFYLYNLSKSNEPSPVKQHTVTQIKKKRSMFINFRISQKTNPKIPVNPKLKKPPPPVTNCRKCFASESPVWRKKKSGKLSDLCNACGLSLFRNRDKKEKQRKAAAILQTLKD